MDAEKPDLKAGISLDQLVDGGMVLGTVDGEEVIVARRHNEFFAVGAHCTHYHGPLAQGLIVDDTVRCPWHHACFSLRTGEAVRAPALDPLPRWRVERVDNQLFVRGKSVAAGKKKAPNVVGSANMPTAVVIIGGGAAGLAAADMLRREGYAGPLTLISADASPPCDRPNLSKDYLAGTAQEDWVALRPQEYYTERNIDLVLNARASAIDVRNKIVSLGDGRSYRFDALLIATGADPVRLPVPGATDAQIHYLRTFADSRAIISHAMSAKRVVVVGASFIGLEVAASLRTRGVEVHVVAPDRTPLERVMGAQVGAYVRELHEQHGVVFHLAQTVTGVEGRRISLSDATVLDADFLVLGVGVRPSTVLAEQAGLNLDRGVLVNEYLQSSAPGIFAAGDIARWPDPYSGERIRVEHWVVAQRQGQVAARNMLGRRERFNAVPFFWSQHYDISINYVGHAENWDAVEIDGSLQANDCAVTYKRGRRVLAVATIFRDLQSLKTELTMERNEQ